MISVEVRVRVRVRVRVMVRLRIRLRDRDWVISDATNNATSRSRDQFSSTRGTSLNIWGEISCHRHFNKDPTKNVYLVIIYKKTWYFSESKTIDVHCGGAKMFSHLLRHVILESMREKCKIV